MYTLNTDTGIVTRDIDGKQVAPCDSPTDRDFKTYLAWINAGGQVTTEQSATAYIPAPITDTQARLVLLDNNLLDGFEQWISSDPERAIWWETADIIHFNNPQVQAAITNELVTPEQMVMLFDAAAKF